MDIRPVTLLRSIGITLIAMGIVALIGQFLPGNIGAAIWPFLVIIPGVLVFVFAMGIDVSLGEPFAMLSGLVTMVGVLLLYSSLTGHWESWAYAWTLAAPTGIGIAQMLFGRIQHRDSVIRRGTKLANIGFVMFLVGLIFFELILNISGLGLGFIGWPILFIAVGILVLARELLRRSGSVTT